MTWGNAVRNFHLTTPGDRITDPLVHACVPIRTQITFMRKGHTFVIRVPGALTTPPRQALNPVWEVDVDGRRRMLMTTLDVGLYVRMRERILLKHGRTFTKLANLLLAAGSDLNRKPFGE